MHTIYSKHTQRLVSFGATNVAHRLFTTHVVWKGISNCSNYEASTNGQIRNRRTGHILQPEYRSNASIVRIVRDDGTRQCTSMSRVILSTFKPHPNANELVAGHKDGNSNNNSLSNLDWCTHTQILKDTIQRLGKGIHCIPVTVSMFDDDKFIKSIKCESIKQGLLEINMFFEKDMNLAALYCAKRKKSNINTRKWVVADPDPDSRKTCSIRYCDQSMYDTVVESLENEEWRMWFEDKKQQQFVSNLGRVKTRCHRTGVEKLKNQHQCDGYSRVSLKVVNRRYFTRFLTHRLVAQLFVSNKKNYPIVDHIDGNSTNNHATNLRWVKDIKENMNNPITKARLSQRRNNNFNGNMIVQIDRDTNEQIKEWKNARAVQFKLGFQSSNILRCCRGEKKTAYGYRWQFAVVNS